MLMVTMILVSYLLVKFWIGVVIPWPKPHTYVQKYRSSKKTVPARRNEERNTNTHTTEREGEREGTDQRPCTSMSQRERLIMM